MEKAPIGRTAMPKTNLPALMTTLMALPGTISADIVFNNFVDDDHFVYVAYDMADFDQQRLGDLPNNGVCYCGPAAAGDLLAYVSTHGYPEYEPGVPFLLDWESNFNYDQATELLAMLGTNTGTSAGFGGGECGISGNALQSELASQIGDKFVVEWDVRSFSTGTEVRLSDIAEKNHLDDSIVLIMYGRYNGSMSDDEFKISRRTGGHFVAVNAALAFGGDAQLLGTRDPWATLGTDSVQEDFLTNVWELQPQTVASSASTNTINMDLLGDPYSDDTRIRALDGYLSVSPKSGFTWDPYTPSTFLEVIPDIGLWMPEAPRSPFSIDKHVTRIRQVPNRPEFIAEIDQELVRIDRLRGGISPLPPLPKGPMSGFDVDRFGWIHVAVRKQLAMIDANDRVQVLDMPGNIDAVTAADLSGRLADDHRAPVMHVLMAQAGLVATVHLTPSGHDVDFRSIPAAKLEQGSGFILQGEIAAILNAGRVQFFKVGKSFQPVSIKGVPDSEILDAMFDGDVLVLIDSKMNARTFEIGDDMHEVKDHPFSRLKTRGRLQITQSRNGALPWETFGSESTEQELWEDQAAAKSQADCRADLNADGKVDSGDIGLLLGAWGQGRSVSDINRDGAVDSGDLGMLLGSFGTCR